MAQLLANWFSSIWKYFQSLFGYGTPSIIYSTPPPQIAEVFGEDAERLFQFPERLDNATALRMEYQCNCLGKYTIINNEELKQEIQRNLFADDEQSKKFFSEIESKCLACFFGMAIGDALGAPLEFSRLDYERKVVTGFDCEEVFNRFALKKGQWTDDTSMGLCMAESLLLYPDFNPIDLRVRFLNWWDFGYRNAFGYDELKHSIGLGGCIGSSFTEFTRERSEYTKAGDRYTSGNGSIMRLAPVPILYHQNIEMALDIAYKQSKTTHQGEEAAECCRLMTFIIISFIQCTQNISNNEKKVLVFNLVKENFKSNLYSVQCLADSVDEEEHPTNQMLELDDRKWDWKSAEFRYCVSRATKNSGYIGSYCMDGLAMALHCVWHTETFCEAMLKVVNLGGDADTVGSIAGQIAGSLYGVEQIPKDWIRSIQQWDNSGDIALTGISLIRRLNNTP